MRIVDESLAACRSGCRRKDRMRPGSGKALRLLESADAQALVAAKRERLSQALLDLASLLATAQKQGWALVALDCALEGTTPAGEALASVLASFAPCERRLISQRTREALARKRAQGTTGNNGLACLVGYDPRVLSAVDSRPCSRRGRRRRPASGQSPAAFTGADRRARRFAFGMIRRGRAKTLAGVGST